MRIISSWRDFYDGGMAYGLDRSIIYVRESQEIKLDNDKYHSYDSLNPFYVGFCGKIYPGVMHLYPDKNYNYQYKIFYKKEEVVQFIEDNPDLDRLLSFDKYSKSSFNKHFTEENYSGLKNIFSKYNVPCFVKDIHKNVLITNPPLRDWEFFKVLDPWTTYLELSMYVSGVLLSNVKPIPEIDDETLASAKGFDKWSFRKEPRQSR